jgi:hypothetical protein
LAQSGDWGTQADWDWGTVPESTDDVLFDQPGAYGVTISGTASARSLTFDAAGATLDETTGSLTVTGDLIVDAGEVALNGTNSIGAVNIDDGIVAVSSSDALGSGNLQLFGGELLADASVTLANEVALDGVDQIAAAPGVTLTLTGNAILNGNSDLVFGASGATGTVQWQANAFSLGVSAEANLDVRAGALRFENYDMGLTAIGDAWTTIDVESGATLDLDGVPTTVDFLEGSGTITWSSGFGEDITVAGGDFTGTLGDDIALTITGNLTLSGHSSLSGIVLSPGMTLVNARGGVVDYDTGADILVSTVGQQAYFRNGGSFLRGGAAGNVSTVPVLFVNDGYMANTGGSMTFTGGFYNEGVLEGILTTNPGGSVTWTADAVGAPLTYVGGGSDDEVFSLSAAPGHVAGGTGTNTIDVLASMMFAAGSVVNVQRYVIENGVTANLSALAGAETIILAADSGGGASVTGTNGADAFLAYAGGAAITFGSATGNTATLDATAGNWDSVDGSGGTVNLTDAQAAVTGGGDTIDFSSGSGNIATLQNTGNAWDAVYGSNGAIYLISAQAAVIGGGDTVDFYGGSGNVATLETTNDAWDSVYGSDATVYLISAQAALIGGGDAAHFYSGSGNVATLEDTNNAWDSVYGSNGTVYLISAQAAVMGGGDAVHFYSGSGNVATLEDTGNAWDSIYGSNGTTYLISAQAAVIGGGDTVDFYSGSGNAASLNGTGYAIMFNAASFGLDTVNGYSSADALSFAIADQGRLAITQSGANTLITLDSNDIVTLTNVQVSNLGPISYHL